MKFKIQIVLDDEQGQTQIEDIIRLEKTNSHGYCAGLSLLESKQLLKMVQQKIILRQAEEYTHVHRACPCCHQQRRIKGYHTLQYKTLFGTVVIPSLRLYQCKCSVSSTKTVSPSEPEHLLDWFHITMRLTVLKQFAKGLIRSNQQEGEEVTQNLKSAKWYLWHGNVEKALDGLEECYLICDSEENHYKNKKKFLKHLEEMNTYIYNNRHLIPNYGERWRYGETISSSFVESTVNEVVTKRMAKKQQMQWSHQGAHCLLQARTATLNGDLPKHFERWYPGINIEGDDQTRLLKSAKAA